MALSGGWGMQWEDRSPARPALLWVRPELRVRFAYNIGEVEATSTTNVLFHSHPRTEGVESLSLPPLPLYACRIRFVSPSKVLVLPSQARNEESMRSHESGGLAPNSSLSTSQFRKNLLDILLAQPLVSLAFEDMQMVVNKPEARQQRKMDRK